ncbi:hypothetical protein DPMN_135067 [Dreissena polymorpha]|uniref:Uncharacterized protein n=1 Tax=Dreissena polymorpha TaxID=45954 RepID=A0A9D4G145_DREPO|nr:hypothetical protein DPMN_135067 [Dreissena polymorpha]
MSSNQVSYSPSSDRSGALLVPNNSELVSYSPPPNNPFRYPTHPLVQPTLVSYSPVPHNPLWCPTRPRHNPFWCPSRLLQP